MNEIITTYEPDNSLKKGYLSIFSEIYNELKRNKWLTYQLLKKRFFYLKTMNANQSVILKNDLKQR